MAKKKKDPSKMSAGEQVALIKQQLGYTTFHKPPKYWLNLGNPRLNSVMGSEEFGTLYGKMVLLCGDYSSGKTLVGNLIMGLAQADGASCGVVDIENSSDPPFSRRMAGFDFGEKLPDGSYTKVALFRAEAGIFSKKDKKGKRVPTGLRLQTAEELFKLVESWMFLQRQINPTGKIALLIDSTTAIVPERELEAGIDEQNMPSRLSLPVFLNGLLKRWQQVALNTNALIVLISQIRINPGVMFGNPEKIPGGKGQYFYPAIICQLRRGKKRGVILDSEGDVIGLNTVMKNLKNKVGGHSVEGRRCGVRIMFPRRTGKKTFSKGKWKFLPAKALDKPTE